jgi:hypothetical protein
LCAGSATRTCLLCTAGEFAFDFRLCNHATATVTAAATAGKGANAKPATPHGSKLELGQFLIEPATGTVSVLSLLQQLRCVT